MIMDEDYPLCTRLLHCKQGLDSLHHVADEKGVCLNLWAHIGRISYRYSVMSKFCVEYKKMESSFSEVGSLKFHRYNQEKTLEWLKKKVYKMFNLYKNHKLCQQ